MARSTVQSTNAIALAGVRGASPPAERLEFGRPVRDVARKQDQGVHDDREVHEAAVSFIGPIRVILAIFVTFVVSRVSGGRRAR